jgi:hypothetical protein
MVRESCFKTQSIRRGAMKGLSDLNIVIPGDRKAGKYLQKIYPVSDLSALVKSLDFCAVEFQSKKEWFLALDKCHSCQSGDNSELFYRVYSQLPDIKLIGLVDKNQTPVTRCLINTKNCTYAPIYGHGHFMLEQRLTFAGYEAGEVASKKEIKPLLNSEDRPVCPPDKFPKSIRKIKLQNYFLPEKPKYPAEIDKSILKNKIEAAEEFCFEVPETAYFSAIERSAGKMVRRFSPENADREIFREIETWEKQVKKAEEKWAKYENGKKRYDKAYKKYKPGPGISYGEVFYRNIEYLAPIAETHELIREERKESFKTTLYLDSEKQFLSGTHIVHAGWYQK